MSDNKDEKIKVYLTQLDGYCGPCVWKTEAGAVGELQGLLDDMAIGDKWTITVSEMTRAELEAVPEFAGY